MRFRVGLAVGFAAGYVLGTRAGRERYEQLAAMARKAMGSATGQTGSSEFEGVAANLADEPFEPAVRQPAVPGRSEGGNGKL